MQGDVIELFMWGFQRSFRTSLELLVGRSLEILGAPCDATVYLIGILQPEGQGHPLCIEPVNVRVIHHPNVQVIHHRDSGDGLVDGASFRPPPRTDHLRDLLGQVLG